jgi:chromosome segregation ATPase
LNHIRIEIETIQELERMIKNAQKRSDVEGKASAAQLSRLQSRFTELDGKISALQTNQETLSYEISTMKDQTTQHYNDIRGNIVTSMEATNDISQSMVDIRQQFSQMSTFMMEIARRMEIVIDRLDGVPPEVNVTRPPNGHHQHGSETSSVIGDPSQTALLDASKTISLLSSNW